jgi:hypothetical protein
MARTLAGLFYLTECGLTPPWTPGPHPNADPLSGADAGYDLFQALRRVQS